MASESKVARVSPPDAISPVAAVEAPAASIQPSKAATSAGATRGPTSPSSLNSPMSAGYRPRAFARSDVRVLGQRQRSSRAWETPAAMPLLLAGVTAALWGAADFLGGLSAASWRAMRAGAVAQAVGVAVLLPVLPFLETDRLTAADIGWGGRAGGARGAGRGRPGSRRATWGARASWRGARDRGGGHDRLLAHRTVGGGPGMESRADGCPRRRRARTPGWGLRTDVRERGDLASVRRQALGGVAPGSGDPRFEGRHGCERSTRARPVVVRGRCRRGRDGAVPGRAAAWIARARVGDRLSVPGYDGGPRTVRAAGDDRPGAGDGACAGSGRCGAHRGVLKGRSPISRLSGRGG